MNDGRSTTPEPTTIPGWRLILSDAGRLWASREEPFSRAAFHAGAERTVDADSLKALRAHPFPSPSRRAVITYRAGAKKGACAVDDVI